MRQMEMETLLGRIEWCAGLAAALPFCETKNTLENLAREYALQLNAAQQEIELKSSDRAVRALAQ